MFCFNFIWSQLTDHKFEELKQTAKVERFTFETDFKVICLVGQNEFSSNNILLGDVFYFNDQRSNTFKTETRKICRSDENFDNKWNTSSQ